MLSVDLAKAAFPDLSQIKMAAIMYALRNIQYIIINNNIEVSDQALFC